MSRAHVALKLRLAPETKAKLEALAGAAGLTVSAWVTTRVDAVRMVRDPGPHAGRRLREARREAQGRRG